MNKFLFLEIILSSHYMMQIKSNCNTTASAIRDINKTFLELV